MKCHPQIAVPFATEKRGIRARNSNVAVGPHAATVKAKYHRVRDYALQRGLLESAVAAATEMEEHLRNMYGPTGTERGEEGGLTTSGGRRPRREISL